MANRSNRRRQNPTMTTCDKHDKATGSWRANSPSWPGVDKSTQHLEAGYTCAVVPYRQRTECLQTERGSIYGHSFGRSNTVARAAALVNAISWQLAAIRKWR